MICVSIGEVTAGEAARLARGAELVELRLDSIEGGTAERWRLYERCERFVATCRPGELTAAERRAILIDAIEHGAAYVDVELEAPASHRRAVIAAARRRKCKVIVSFHDFQATPGRARLQRIIQRCFALGGDLAKVACRVRERRDAARLLGLLDSKKPVVIAGMGPLGGWTRAVAPLLGAPFTFAAPRGGRPTAPGQPDAGRLARAIETLRALEPPLPPGDGGTRAQGERRGTS